MTIHKLVAPTDATGVIGNWRDPDQSTQLILGVGYTDSDNVAEWAAARGYRVDQIDEIPSEHLAKSARLAAWPGPITAGLVDAADPDSRYRFTGPDGRTYDVRDVINGKTTCDATTGAVTTI